MGQPTLDVGMCADRTFAPGDVVEMARRLDAGGAGRLWLIEDCFYTAGVSLAAAVLAVTERLGVGLGILPAVARNPAITAMEISTLCGLGPGRVLPGIGHGVQDWMAQMGVRPASPVTALDEVLVAVRRLLAGERVTHDGAYVHLDDVVLDQPPATPPPVLAGVRGPRSLAMAGRSAGGLVLAEPATPTVVRDAVAQADPGERDFHIATFAMLCVERERREAHRHVAPWLADVLDQDLPALRAWPFHDDLMALYQRDGVDGLVTMPRDWWSEIGPIGTRDDAAAHLDALAAAGVHSVGLFPAPDIDVARAQLEEVVALATG